MALFDYDIDVSNELNTQAFIYNIFQKEPTQNYKIFAKFDLKYTKPQKNTSKLLGKFSLKFSWKSHG